MQNLSNSETYKTLTALIEKLSNRLSGKSPEMSLLGGINMLIDAIVVDVEDKLGMRDETYEDAKTKEELREEMEFVANVNTELNDYVLQKKEEIERLESKNIKLKMQVSDLAHELANVKCDFERDSEIKQTEAKLKDCENRLDKFTKNNFKREKLIQELQAENERLKESGNDSKIVQELEKKYNDLKNDFAIVVNSFETFPVVGKEYVCIGKDDDGDLATANGLAIEYRDNISIHCVDYGKDGNPAPFSWELEENELYIKESCLDELKEVLDRSYSN